MTFVYLDLETTGLDPRKHQVWQAAYAVGDGPIVSGVMTHTLDGADPNALEISRYSDVAVATSEVMWDYQLSEVLTGATIVGANPAFDAKFLAARWGSDPWHYRLLDVESYAMGWFGWEKPAGLHAIWEAFMGSGQVLPAPDHTAAGDVACVRAVHRTLARLYAGSRA